MVKVCLAAVVASVVASAAFSASVTPITYEMQNGQGQARGGSFNYTDESYDGVGAPVGTELAYLSGGTGDLTDGIIATQSWYTPGQDMSTGQVTSTPYVGWLDINPRIVFNFGSAIDFNSVTFYFDTSNFGGVRRPASVEVNDSFQSVVPNSSNPAPFAHTIDLTGLAPAQSLTFDIFSQHSSWVFLSEVTFDANVPAVPLPASGMFLIAGLGGLIAVRRRKK